jgi:general secretion pathway protein D
MLRPPFRSQPPRLGVSARTAVCALAMLGLPCSLALSAPSRPASGKNSSPEIERADVDRLRMTSDLKKLKLEADQNIVKADAKLREKDFEGAFLLYLKAYEPLSELPTGGPAETSKNKALNGIRDAGLELARVRISEGRYSKRAGETNLGASEILSEIIKLHKNSDKQCKAAERLQEQLNTPGFFNKTITPSFRVEVEEVKHLLQEAQGFYQRGSHDLALKRTDQVLEIDPYNKAARNLQEVINREIYSYSESAYNEARSRALRNVQKAWASPIKKASALSTGATTGQISELSKIEKLTQRIKKLTLPKLQLDPDLPLFEIARILQEKARKADPNQTDPPISIIVSRGSSDSAPAPGASAQTPISNLNPSMGGEDGLSGRRLTLPEIPSIELDEVLKIVTQAANAKYVIKEKYIEIVPATVKTETTTSRTWIVSPFIFSSTAPQVSDLSSTTGVGNLLNSAPKPAGGRSGKKVDVKQFLIDSGVKFEGDATVTYNPRNKQLYVVNTPDQLDLVASIVENSEGVNPVQVEISAKFIEFTQANLKELSFDWLLGQANVPSSSSVFFGGGTPGSQRGDLKTGDYPFGIPKNPLLPNNGTPVGTFPVTGGNRSGKMALSANAIDALLMGSSASGAMAAPALFGLAGAFTDPQFQLVIRALNQKKGVDLLSSPSITAEDNREATISIVREFRYPTEFTPPQIPQSIGGIGGGAGGAVGGLLGGGAPPSIPVTPTTPSAWGTRNTGVTLIVTPKIMGDNFAVQLQMEPEVVEFEGFINYGSPIKSVSPPSTTGNLLPGVSQTPTEVTLTDNVINQPIFAVRKLSTNVTVLDGETITLGGLIREDVQKVNDKTPILGDIPLVGRLFRSNVDSHIKKNLTIFVTARILDAAGQPVKVSRTEIEPQEVPSLTEDLGFGN